MPAPIDPSLMGCGLVTWGTEQLIDDYALANRNDQFNLYSGNNTGGGQAVTLAAETRITKFNVALLKVGSPTGNAVTKIYAATGTVGSNAVPTGSALATSDTVDVSTISTSWALVQFDFSSLPVLPAGDYVFVIEYSGGNSSNRVGYGVDNTSPGDAGNCVIYNSGWAAYSGIDSLFEIYGQLK